MYRWMQPEQEEGEAPSDRKQEAEDIHTHTATTTTTKKPNESHVAMEDVNFGFYKHFFCVVLLLEFPFFWVQRDEVIVDIM